MGFLLLDRAPPPHLLTSPFSFLDTGSIRYKIHQIQDTSDTRCTRYKIHNIQDTQDTRYKINKIQMQDTQILRHLSTDILKIHRYRIHRYSRQDISS